jgi:hypothetical protein
MFFSLAHISTAEKIVTSVKNIRTFKLPNSCKNSAGIWQHISAKDEDSYASRSTMKAVLGYHLCQLGLFLHGVQNRMQNEDIYNLISAMHYLKGITTLYNVES